MCQVLKGAAILGTGGGLADAMSVVLVDPGVVKADLVVGEHGGKRALTVRDAQHEYVFDEVK